jgi:pilus assembly protein FimV
VKPVEPPKPVEAPKPVDPPKPVESPKPKAPPPPPVEEPGVLDGLMEDPLPLAGGAGIIALLAGLFMYKRRRSANSGAETTAIPGPSSLGPNSVFRMTGGQSVDTGNTPPQTGDFSQTGPGTIDTDEVDPVAEADVYMAYGRDTQAEEILLEALQKDPQRTAIHAKLLEIYANRRSLKQFETLASELYAQTGGLGAEWEKVAALGAGLDPNNPLYSGANANAPVFDANATMIVTPENAAKATLAMPGAMAGIAAAAAVMAEEAPVKAETEDTFILDTPVQPVVSTATASEPVFDVSAEEPMSLDFDIGMPELPAAVTPLKSGEPFIDTVVSVDSNALDFDLGGDAPVAAAPAPLDETHVDPGVSLTDLPEAVDFSLDPDPLPEAAATKDLPDFSPEGTLVMPSSYSLDELPDASVSTFVGLEDGPQSVAPNAVLDDRPMVDFDLDIGAPAIPVEEAPVAGNAMLETMVAPQGFAPEEPAELLAPPAASPVMTDLSATIVNPSASMDDTLEFDVKLTDSVFLGQPMMPSDFDMGAINLDLGAEPQSMPDGKHGSAESLPEPNMPLAETVLDADGDAGAEPLRDERWEEVNTKLDLAKAYEEMGDMEGARELLQEVVGEGSIDLVEQAKSILARLNA